MARFDKTYCSQCGHEFGPGEHGYSHCDDHVRDAAPELLAALQGMLNEWERQTRYGSPMAKAANPRVSAARAAIAKATGTP